MGIAVGTGGGIAVGTGVGGLGVGVSLGVAVGGVPVTVLVGVRVRVKVFVGVAVGDLVDVSVGLGGPIWGATWHPEKKALAIIPAISARVLDEMSLAGRKVPSQG